MNGYVIGCSVSLVCILQYVSLTFSRALIKYPENLYTAYEVEGSEDTDSLGV